MPVELLNLTLPMLKALAADRSRIGDLEVATEAVPDFIVRAALESLEAGRCSVWYSPFLFLSGVPPKAVGSGSFKGVPQGGRVELGYGVDREHQRRGIATEAVRQLLSLAFSDPAVREVYAESAIANEPSRRILMKAGFHRIARRYSKDDGLVDCWVIMRHGGSSASSSRA
jgi:[ribosomal protein S5]-alanine N-acetyltransferase